MKKSLQIAQPLSMLTVALAVCLPGAALAGDVQFADRLFDHHELTLEGTGEHATVLSGFLLDRSVAELVVVSVDDDGSRRLRIYSFAVQGAGVDGPGGMDGAWQPTLEAKLGADVLFVDIASIGGLDRMITYQNGGVSWFDPEAGTCRKLVKIATDYKSTHDHKGSPSQPGGDPPHVDITRDLNRDGRDDLVVPDLDGFWISIQRSDGSFTDAVKLGPPEPFRDELVGNLDPGGGGSDKALTYGDLGITASTLPWYLSRVHEMDYDHDGRSDLVFWNQDHFDVHLQDENGLFASEPLSFVPDVPFDSEGVYSRGFDFSGQGFFSLLFGFGKKTQATVLHSLRDLNGDDVADLVTLTLSGRTAAKQRSVYEVHFGRAIAAGAARADGTEARGGTVFTRAAGTVLQPRGKGGAMQPWGYSVQRFEDLDGDGQLESLFKEVTVGVLGMARALVGNSVPINLELYRMEGRAYPERPTLWRKIRRFAPFAGLGNVFFPTVLIGDIDGDGRADLLIGHSPKELGVFLGVPGSDLFAQRPRKVAVALPSDERKTSLVDLNQDGKQDILVHRGPTGHAPAEPHRLALLIAR